MIKINILKELNAQPKQGKLPFECTLSFRAQSISGDVLVDIAYDILENEGEELRVAFATSDGHSKRVWKKEVMMRGLPQGVTKKVKFVEAPGDTDPGLVAVEAKIFLSGQTDPSSIIEKTSCVVRVLLD